MVVALAQTFLMFRRGAKWMSAMTIGAYCFACVYVCMGDRRCDADIICQCWYRLPVRTSFYA
jgi:hypothetical protein